ncbi:MAG: glycosyltransferase family 2 protein [Chthoniobacterales bacterium]
MRPKVSVALCTFNGAAHLSEQLGSFADQTLEPDEVVACDDGSTDATLEILNAFAKTAPFPVRIVSNPENLGIARNFAQAISLCRGDIILLSDQDDVWLPGKVRRFVDIFAAHPEVEGLFSNALIADSNLLPTGTSLWQELGLIGNRRAQVMSSDAIEAVIWGNPVYGTVFGFRASALQILLPIPFPLPGYVIHDGWMAMILGCRGTLRGFDEKLSFYRQHTSQQSGLGGRAPLGVLAKLRRSATERTKGYHEHVEELKTMSTLLSAHHASATFDLTPLAERIRFCEFRLDLPDNGMRRMQLIGKELLQGNYRKHTGQWLQPMVRDVLAF